MSQQVTKEKYSIETLRERNVSYDHQHWLTQEDVDMANSYVELIERTRSKITPQIGEVHVDVQKLPAGFDAYAICTGTPTARDLSMPGRERKGIYFALDMLAQQNHILDGDTFPRCV